MPSKLTTVTLRRPITHNTWENGKFTTYEIEVMTEDISFTLNHSVVRRRYSEFHWLWLKLKKNHGNNSVPSLPPKKFSPSRFNTEFIKQRKILLELFLKQLLAERVYLSDVCLHMFLQTSLSIREMENYLRECNSQSLEALWEELKTNFENHKLKLNSTNPLTQSDLVSSKWFPVEPTSVFLTGLGVTSSAVDISKRWSDEVSKKAIWQASHSYETISSSLPNESSRKSSQKQLNHSLCQPDANQMKKRVSFSNEVTVAEIQVFCHA